MQGGSAGQVGRRPSGIYRRKRISCNMSQFNDLLKDAYDLRKRLPFQLFFLLGQGPAC